MNLQDFISKYNGKKVGSGQCVALYRKYCEEVLRSPQSPLVVGAADIWNTYLSAYYERIPNTPTGVPKEGDIVIWDRKLNGYGHVSMFKSGNVFSFTSFDQNWLLDGLCHIQKHSYKHVLGWLRPRKSTAVIRVARIGSNLSSSDVLKSEVARFSQNRILLLTQDYNIPITDSGMLTQDEAYAFINSHPEIKETFVQLYYQTPNAPFLTSYSYPAKKKFLSTLPNNQPARSIAFELSHCLQFYCNDVLQAQISIEDSNFPDDNFIFKKYETLFPYLGRIN